MRPDIVLNHWHCSIMTVHNISTQPSIYWVVFTNQYNCFNEIKMNEIVSKKILYLGKSKENSALETGSYYYLKYDKRATPKWVTKSCDNRYDEVCGWKSIQDKASCLSFNLFWENFDIDLWPWPLVMAAYWQVMSWRNNVDSSSAGDRFFFITKNLCARVEMS